MKMITLVLFLLLLTTNGHGAATSFRKYSDLSYVSSNPHPQHQRDLYVPNDTGPFPVVVWIHAGAWFAGDKRRVPILELAQNSYIVASVNFRHSHQAIFPAQIHDLKAAIRWLRANADAYRIDPNYIGVIGHSSGGHLAGILGTSSEVAMLEDLSLGHAEYSSRVQAVVPASGPTDFLQMEAQKPARCKNDRRTIDNNAPRTPTALLIGCEILSCPEQVAFADPATYASADDPPFWIQNGADDCVVPAGQAKYLQQALQNKGVTATLDIIPKFKHACNFHEKIKAFPDLHLKH